MIKKLLLLCLIFFAVASIAQAKPELDKTVKSFFPKPSQLTGGEERWLGTAITEKDIVNGFVYTTAYSYYSPKEQSIMNIKRKKTFDVKASIYAFNNYVSAYDQYDLLAKKAPKGKVQEIAFGDRGIFYYIPNSSYINDANFTIVFINKIFVAEITADDGFALMDAAANINADIHKFIISNLEYFIVRNISLSVTADGFERFGDILGFTEEEPSEITIKGTAFSDDVTPLKDAEVTFLETGKTIKTDKNGAYSYTVKMGGNKPVVITKNFYLKKIETDTDKSLSLEDGVFAVNIDKEDGASEPSSVWKLAFYGNTVHGKALMGEEGRQRLYPLRGTYESGVLLLNLDCRTQGSSFKCARNFEGKIDESGILEGSWTGTGGGGKWKLHLNSYAETTEYIYLNEDNSNFRKLSFKNGETKIDEGALVVSSSDAGVTGVLFSLEKDKPEFNEVFIKSAKLVLTHLPQQQFGTISLFRFITETKNNKIYPVAETMVYAGDLSVKQEYYEIEADVTDYIFSSARSGVLISPMLEGDKSGASHLFAGVDAKPAAYAPRLKTIRYIPSDEADEDVPISIKIETVSGKDVVGNTNTIRPDGKPDTIFDAVFKMPGKTITSMEIFSEEMASGKRNTEPLDIYSVIGFIKNDVPVNETNGSVSILLEEPIERFKLHIAPIRDNANEELKYRITISGKVFEGTIEK